MNDVGSPACCADEVRMRIGHAGLREVNRGCKLPGPGHRLVSRPLDDSAGLAHWLRPACAAAGRGADATCKPGMGGDGGGGRPWALCRTLRTAPPRRRGGGEEGCGAELEAPPAPRGGTETENVRSPSPAARALSCAHCGQTPHPPPPKRQRTPDAVPDAAPRRGLQAPAMAPTRRGKRRPGAG